MNLVKLIWFAVTLLLLLLATQLLCDLSIQTFFTIHIKSIRDWYILIRCDYTHQIQMKSSPWETDLLKIYATGSNKINIVISLDLWQSLWQKMSKLHVHAWTLDKLWETFIIKTKVWRTKLRHHYRISCFLKDVIIPCQQPFRSANLSRMYSLRSSYTYINFISFNLTINGIKVRVVFLKIIERKHLCCHVKNFYYFCKSNISVINLILGFRNMIKVSKNMSF